MEDFPDAKVMLEEAGAGVQVSSPEMLAERAVWFFGHPDALNRYGARAREAALKNHGAAERHAQVIGRLLKSDQE
jgi:3-deoxy-D-manno-octulosonic-acid transferase